MFEEKPHILISPISLLVLFLFMTFASYSQDGVSDILLTVDGEPVVEEEFIFFMKDQRALTYSYFYTRHEAEPVAEFWTTSCSGEIPVLYIRNKTIEQITDIKVHLILARELGLLEDISYEAYLSRFGQENSRRKKAVQNGEVIYGPEEFSKEAFFSYWYSNLLISFRNEWRKNQSPGEDSTEENIRSQADHEFLLFIENEIAGADVKITVPDIDEILLRYLK